MHRKALNWLVLALVAVGCIRGYVYFKDISKPYSEQLLATSREYVSLSREAITARESARHKSTISSRNPVLGPADLKSIEMGKVNRHASISDADFRLLTERNGGLPPRLFQSPDGTLRAISGEFGIQGMEHSDAALSLVSGFPGVFGIGAREEFVVTKRPTQSGSIVRMARLYDSLPVWGRELVVTIENNQIVSVTGKMLPISADLDLTSSRTSRELNGIAREALDVPKLVLSFAPVKEGIFLVGNVPVHSARVPVVSDAFKAWDVFISLSTGEVLAITPKHYQISTESSGFDLGGARRQFSSISQSGLYLLRDRTFVGIAESSIVDWVDGENFVYSSSNSPNSGWDRAAVSAIYNASQVHEYYLDTHDRVSFDGGGAELTSVVNVTGDYVDNASWYANTMWYGAGSRYQNWAISLDVAAHEFTHGVIEAESNLRYQNQSGAINESFADFFGVMVERQNWLIGEELFSDSFGFFRSMSNPQSRGQPAHFDNYYYTSLYNDHGGVHINSGIQNRALYLISQGLSDEGLGTSIGSLKTEKIAYETLLRLSQDAEFIDSAILMQLQAEKLYGEGSPEVLAVVGAWEEVGVSVVESVQRQIDPDENFSLAAGDEVLVHLYPRDGTLDDMQDRDAGYDVYVSVINQPFEGYNEDLLIGPINDYPAMGIRPSVATVSSGETYVSYTGVDGNAYITFISEDSEDSVIDVEGDISYTALSADASKFALVFAGDNVIWVVDLQTEQVDSYEVVGPDYSEDGAGVSVEVVDSINFDYAGKKLIFDYSSCVPDPESLGSCVSIWGIGVLDLNKGFSYPFPNQRTDVDLGFPNFSRIRDDVIVFDFVDYQNFDEEGRAVSNVLVYESDSRKFHGIVDTNGSELLTRTFGIPSFVGNDEAITFTFQEDSRATQWQAAIDENYDAVSDPFSQLLPYDSGFGQAHRNAFQNVIADLEVSDTRVEFGRVLFDGSVSRELLIENNGTRAIELLNIKVPNGVTTNLTNLNLVPGEQVRFSLELNASLVDPGIWTGVLRIEHDGDNGPVDIGLTATVEESLDYDRDGIPDETDLDDDNDGVSDLEDAFPRDKDESLDSDGDGTGNNEDLDDDNDQIPDIYEKQNGLDPLADDSADDPDGDGKTNLEEYQSGTDPNVDEICSNPSGDSQQYDDSALFDETRLSIVNPASNLRQQSFIRLVNRNSFRVDVELYGIDDRGVESARGPITFSLGRHSSVHLTAQDLERGNESKGIANRFCDGTGKWQIVVRSSAVIEAQSLIRTPDGFLTNLSEVVPSDGVTHFVDFANPASNNDQQTFLRIVNHSDRSGEIFFSAIDDVGATTNGVSLEIGALQSIQLTSQDLEWGNLAKGLRGSFGNGFGKWRLEVSSELDLSVLSLIRSSDGFLTNLSSPVPPKMDSNDETIGYISASPAANFSPQSFNAPGETVSPSSHEFAFGVGTAVENRIYARFEVEGATFGSNIEESDFDVEVSGGSGTADLFIVTGGLIGENFIIFEVVPQGAPLKQSDVATLQLPVLETNARSNLILRFEVYEILTGAVNSKNALYSTHKVIEEYFGQPDVDGDGVIDSADNCSEVSNADQSDIDRDGLGDVCDPLNNLLPDEDGDLVPDEEDNCPSVANENQADEDGDGVGDACEINLATHMVYFALPSDSSGQQSFIRISNRSLDQPATIKLSGIDDLGNSAPNGDVALSLNPGSSIQLLSSDLENGNQDKGLLGSLGDGNGNWRFEISADQEIVVMSLVRTPDGFLTNLGAVSSKESGEVTVLTMNPGSNISQRSFLRLINNSSESGTVSIGAYDDRGTGRGPIQIQIAARQVVTVSSQDIESGNFDGNGLLGDGLGKWQLRVTSDIDLVVQSLLVTPSGFLTNLSGAVE